MKGYSDPSLLKKNEQHLKTIKSLHKTELKPMFLLNKEETLLKLLRENLKKIVLYSFNFHNEKTKYLLAQPEIIF